MRNRQKSTEIIKTKTTMILTPVRAESTPEELELARIRGRMRSAALFGAVTHFFFMLRSNPDNRYATLQNFVEMLLCYIGYKGVLEYQPTLVLIYIIYYLGDIVASGVSQAMELNTLLANVTLRDFICTVVGNIFEPQITEKMCLDNFDYVADLAMVLLLMVTAFRFYKSLDTFKFYKYCQTSHKELPADPEDDLLSRAFHVAPNALVFGNKKFI
ncbi:hypothetical protein BJ085DRAFT_33170 [Dimargaris cristalligena]|uniref:Uncharacterized protein n=1 Tax=Dimargaris cristalligena TaxID=215637 RepID=A0A4Q0A186_9FUNG|nr:hypothetical protein BJ085DRAFT_33170 [Dimargaris cristalligena]|eukprot:RKP38900.1 hypothetical protein BJ085DRAFT_33170 [Dimargaris cristalligena]